MRNYEQSCPYSEFSNTDRVYVHVCDRACVHVHVHSCGGHRDRRGNLLKNFQDTFKLFLIRGLYFKLFSIGILSFKQFVIRFQ
jgi:hypothetical protein